MTEPPPIPELPPPPPPERPVDGGRIALTIFATLAASFVFSMGSRLAYADLFTTSTRMDSLRFFVLWVAPIVVLAGAAFYATRRGWRWVAIALWIYVGLGFLTSVACGVLVGGGL